MRVVDFTSHLLLLLLFYYQISDSKNLEFTLNIKRLKHTHSINSDPLSYVMLSTRL